MENDRKRLSFAQQWRDTGSTQEGLEWLTKYVRETAPSKLTIVGITIAIEAAGERIKKLEQALHDAQQTSFNFNQETPK